MLTQLTHTGVQCGRIILQLDALYTRILYFE